MRHESLPVTHKLDALEEIIKGPLPDPEKTLIIDQEIEEAYEARHSMRSKLKGGNHAENWRIFMKSYISHKRREIVNLKKLRKQIPQSNKLIK